MAQDRKKQVSGEIPFHFMQEMGHSPRAMEQFFDRTSLRNVAKLPSSRLQTAAKATANGSDRFSHSNGCTLRCSRFAVFAKIHCLDIFYF